MTRRLTTCAWAILALAPTLAAAQDRAIAGERLTLDAAVRAAVENNRQLLSARLQVEKADSDIATARTHRLPVFATEVTASQLLSPVRFSFPAGAFGDFEQTGPIPSVDTTVSVPRQPTAYVTSQASQPLSQLFRIGLGIRGAEASRDIAREQARGQQLAVVATVKRLYFSILQTQSALAANTDGLELYRELDRTLQVRVSQRVALRGDSLDVQYRLAREELTRTTLQNALASQKEQLNQLLGRDVRTSFEIEDVAVASAIDVNLESARGRALDVRPDVKEARLKLQQAELDRRITKADRVPEVSLAASYTSYFNIDMLPSNLATVGVQVKWEPFDWGRRGDELASRDRTVEQAKLAVRDAEDKAAVEINGRYRTLSEKRAQLAVARMAQATSRERVRVIANRYQEQAALLPDVLQARAELASSDDGYQQALLAFWASRTDFEQAIGEDVIP